MSKAIKVSGKFPKKRKKRKGPAPIFPEGRPLPKPLNPESTFVQWTSVAGYFAAIQMVVYLAQRTFDGPMEIIKWYAVPVAIAYVIIRLRFKATIRGGHFAFFVSSMLIGTWGYIVILFFAMLFPVSVREVMGYEHVNERNYGKRCTLEFQDQRMYELPFAKNWQCSNASKSGEVVFQYNTTLLGFSYFGTWSPERK